jgi:hypothetical protein
MDINEPAVFTEDDLMTVIGDYITESEYIIGESLSILHLYTSHIWLYLCVGYNEERKVITFVFGREDDIEINEVVEISPLDISEEDIVDSTIHKFAVSISGGKYAQFNTTFH